MSHQAQIDYQQVAMQCDAVCGLAEEQLTEMDEMLTQLERTKALWQRGIGSYKNYKRRKKWRTPMLSKVAAPM